MNTLRTGMLMAALLAAIDQTIVGTAEPRIIASLSGFDRYPWVATMYLLSSMVSVPIFASLSDRFGRKPFFMSGVVLFVLASALCGAFPTLFDLVDNGPTGEVDGVDVAYIVIASGCEYTRDGAVAQIKAAGMPALANRSISAQIESIWRSRSGPAISTSGLSCSSIGREFIGS